MLTFCLPAWFCAELDVLGVLPMFVSLLVRKNKMDKAGSILWFHIGFMSIQPIHLVVKKM